MSTFRTHSPQASWRPFVLLATLTIVAAAAPTAMGDDSMFNDPYFCSDWYATHPSVSLDPGKQQRCLIAIAATYLDGEEGSITPEAILFADDVVRYTIGREPTDNNDSAEEIRAQIPGSAAIIKSITNRQWTADVTNGTAFVIYDGYLEPPLGNGNTPDFFVAERLTVIDGLITEIAIGGVQRP